MVRRILVMLSVVACGCLGLFAGGCTPAATPATKAGWGSARQISAISGRVAWSRSSLSCTSPANCTLVYSPKLKAMAVSEVHGDWGRPRVFPVQTPGSYACAAPGECVVAGNSRRTDQAVVVSQVRGVWGSPQQVPGLAGLHRGDYAGINALSCSRAGWCAAAGFYMTDQDSTSHGQYRPFVVSERDGAWLTAQPRPQLADLSIAWSAWISAICCDPEGACTAGGSYSTPSGHRQPFVVSSRDGVWGPGQAIAGVTAPYQDGGIAAISCTAPGNCNAAGTYANSPDRVFVVSEQDGTWGQARDLPGAAVVGKKLGELAMLGLSCAAPGQCAITGYYTSAGEYKYSIRPTMPFIASQVNGRWGKAHAVPGLARLHPGKAVMINSVSCGAPGNCVVGGSYTVPGSAHGFLVTETDGTWGQAAQVPGLADLTSGTSEVGIVHCWSATKCLALGDYNVGTGSTGAHLFVATRR
jgi:hypothetical protein